MTLIWRSIIRILILTCLLSTSIFAEGTILNGGSRKDEPPVPPLPISIPGNVQDTVSAAYGIPNTLVQNDYNMFAAPGTMLRYGTAYGEIWNGSSPWGGASLKLPLGIKTVVFLGRPYSGGLFGNYTNTFAVGNNIRSMPGVAGTGLVGLTTTGGVSGPYGDFAMANTPVLSFDILLGKKITSSMGLGLKYSLYKNKDVTEKNINSTTNVNPDDGTFKNTRLFTEHHFTLGLTMDNFLMFSALDIAVDMTLASLDFEYTETMKVNKSFAKNTLLSDGIPSFSLLVRPIIKLGEDSSLVTLASLSLIDTSSKFESKVDKGNDGLVDVHGTDINKSMIFSDKKTSLALAVAWNTVPAEGFKLITSSGLNFDIRNQKNTVSTWSTNDYTAELKSVSLQVPVGISLEYTVTEFLKLRMGLMKYIIERKTAEGKDHPDRVTTGETTSSTLAVQDNANSFRLTMGVGAKVKDLSIDCAIGTRTFNFETLFTGVSLKYHY